MGVPLQPKFKNLPVELQAEYVQQAERVRQFCGYIITLKKDDLAELFFDVLLGKTLQQIELRGVMELLVKKEIISGEQFTRASIGSMVRYLEQMEKVHDIQIKSEGILTKANGVATADAFEPSEQTDGD